MTDPLFDVTLLNVLRVFCLILIRPLDAEQHDEFQNHHDNHTRAPSRIVVHHPTEPEAKAYHCQEQSLHAVETKDELRPGQNKLVCDGCIPAWTLPDCGQSNLTIPNKARTPPLQRPTCGNKPDDYSKDTSLVPNADQPAPVFAYHEDTLDSDGCIKAAAEHNRPLQSFVLAESLPVSPIALPLRVHGMAHAATTHRALQAVEAVDVGHRRWKWTRVRFGAASSDGN